MPGKRPQLNFDIDPELKKRFRQAALDHQETVKDVLLRAVLDYLEKPNHSGAAKTVPPKPDVPSGHSKIDRLDHDPISTFVLQDPQHRHLFEALVYIIRAGDPGIIQAISNNLDTFLRLARLEAKDVSGKTIEVEVELADDRESHGHKGYAKKSRRAGGNLPDTKPKTA